MFVELRIADVKDEGMEKEGSLEGIAGAAVIVTMTVEEESAADKMSVFNKKSNFMVKTVFALCCEIALKGGNECHKENKAKSLYAIATHWKPKTTKKKKQ